VAPPSWLLFETRLTRTKFVEPAADELLLSSLWQLMITAERVNARTIASVCLGMLFIFEITLCIKINLRFTDNTNTLCSHLILNFKGVVVKDDKTSARSHQKLFITRTFLYS